MNYLVEVGGSELFFLHSGEMVDSNFVELKAVFVIFIFFLENTGKFGDFKFGEICREYLGDR